MNHCGKMIGGLLFTAQIVYAAGALAEGSVDAGNGSITFKDKAQAVCTLNMPDVGKEDVYYLLGDDNSRCKDRITTTRTWALIDLPSATTIILSSDKYCNTTSAANVVIELKTTAKKVFTADRELKFIETYKINSMVNPGLQLKKLHVKQGQQITDSIQCMIVRMSDKPPTPTSSARP